MNEIMRKKEKKRILQTKVIVGKGKSQFFVESDTCIAPPSPPVFKIVAVDAEVEVYDAKLITGGDCECGWAKVLFNAKIKKNVIYKTVEHIHDGTVNGPLYHSTFCVPFGGFVEIEALKGEKIKECDIAEVIKAKFEGAKEVLHDEAIIRCKKEEPRVKYEEMRGCRMNDGCKKHEEACEVKKLEEERDEVKVYNKLLEKMVVEIEFKVVRVEHVCVEEEHCKDECYYMNSQAPLQEEPDLLPPE